MKNTPVGWSKHIATPPDEEFSETIEILIPLMHQRIRAMVAKYELKSFIDIMSTANNPTSIKSVDTEVLSIETIKRAMDLLPPKVKNPIDEIYCGSLSRFQKALEKEIGGDIVISEPVEYIGGFLYGIKIIVSENCPKNKAILVKRGENIGELSRVIGVLNLGEE